MALANRDGTGMGIHQPPMLSPPWAVTCTAEQAAQGPSCLEATSEDASCALGCQTPPVLQKWVRL